jgi:hypothetical protein
MGKHLRVLAWLLPLGTAAIVAAFGTRDPADLPYFVHTARTLLSARWADTFADPSVQVGPLFLLFVGLGDRLGGLDFLAYAVEVGVAGLVVFVVGRALRGRPHRVAAQTVAGLAAVALGLTADAFGYGHPAQVVVPLLWILAALDAREGRTVRSGALLGLSAGLELWGVLGAPVLLLARGRRRALSALATQAAVVAAVYLPFVIAGNFRMFDYRWKVEGWTLVHFVLDPGSDFPWTLRLLQGAAVLAVGSVLALSLRRSERAVWVVPLGIVAVRVLLDPTDYSWYWLGAEAVALAAAAELLTSLPTRWQHSPRAFGSVAGGRRG